ncbi:MAG: hypothetical protein GY853_09535 [PVC group bacterium]|nr:hypothetical protein [PVC group bacterium]
MKKISLIFVMFFVLLTSFIAQERRVIFADTCGNSQSKVFYLDLRGTYAVDSVVISAYNVGEIDLDTLSITAGPNVYAMYKGSRTQIRDYEDLTSVVLTTDLADGVSEYLQDVITLKGVTLKGYDIYKFTLISAATGNDETDAEQKTAWIARVYKPTEYNIKGD